MGDEFKINFDKGFVISLSEEISDGHGHSEGGSLTREHPGFAEELRRYIEIGSVDKLRGLISEAVKGKDPILRRVIGEILLGMNLDAAPIILETRQAQKAEAKAREDAQEKASRTTSLYFPNPDGIGGKWVAFKVNPETGAIGEPLDGGEASKDPQDSINSEQEEDGPSL
jgi:hypothetical protein